MTTQELTSSSNQLKKIPSRCDEVSTTAESLKHFKLLRGDETCTSLKEMVLLRKFQNDRKSKGRWETHPQTPLGDAKDLWNKTEDLRKRLIKNRAQLDHLLQHVPQMLKSQKRNTRHSSTSTNDINNEEILTLPTKSLRPLNGNVFSRFDESSSDEELREPLAEHQPNLSDNESLEAFSTTPPKFPGIHDNTRSEEPLSHTPIPPDCTKSHVVKVTRTSSRAGHITNECDNLCSVVDTTYQQAKPRPPPRRSYLKKRSLSPKETNMTQQNVEPSSFTNGEIATSPKIITLPYVSRGASKERLRRSSRSSVTKEMIEETIQEEEPLKPKNLSASLHTSPSQGVQNVNNLYHSKMKADTSPSRATLSSSGYSSPGSHSGSSSLSASTSNASSTTSANLRVAACDNELNSGSTTASRSDTQTSAKLMVSKKPQSILTQADSAPDSNQEDDDVFPITSWVESSEYHSIVEGEDEKKQNTSNNDLSIDKSSTKRLSTSSSEYSNSISSQSYEISGGAKAESNQFARRPGNRSSSTVGANSISMIEQPPSSTAKIRAPTSVKMRFPVPTKHSKKNAASRNSRVFALQQAKETEEVSSEPLISTTNQHKKSPQSISSDNCEPLNTNCIRKRPSSMSPESFVSDQLAGCKREISASLANLDRVGSSDKLYNTVSGATGRHLSQTSSTFFQDEYQEKLGQTNNNNNRYRSTGNVYNGSTWSLSPESPNSGRNRAERRPSLRNRLKGAFSFQNIRKAISMERLDEDERLKSVSHSYLNEFGEDISQVAQPKPKIVLASDPTSSSGRLYKAPSISSIFSTVRMRKRKSRERRAAKLRNTIAIDPKQIPEYECTPVDKKSSSQSRERINDDCVGTPAHFRPIGRVLQMDTRQGTVLIEMMKPPSGPFGFYLAKNKENGNVYISSMSDSYPDKMYAGLMKLGDEIMDINDTKVEKLSLDEIYNIILENDRLVLRIKPSRVHNV